ncbi:MAG: glycogen/starch synthase [Chitinophagales bacterium]|nr:glycogen/starch synthase [Bacteroidota bacterium]MCB9043794.1 glycogen/starch synthase [Chitinophagales bacterium]
MDNRLKVLVATQEMDPYVLETEMANIVTEWAKYANGKEIEVRILMPRFGQINERRHRLHEVVRLSGINIIIEEDDYPLIIKVASLPDTRMQVYFLDNEEFFKRKEIFADEEGAQFDDNVERAVFFCRGVLETIKKFGWPPDIIHCHGWITSLIPLYIRTAYKKEPVFTNCKIIYSVYSNTISEVLESDFYKKALISRVEAADLEPYPDATPTGLDIGAMNYSDAVIVSTDVANPLSVAYLHKHKTDLPSLEPNGAPLSVEDYMNFYNLLVADTIK